MSIEERIDRLSEMVSENNRMLALLLGESTPRVEPRKYMTVAEASQMTGLSARSLRIYCNRGDIEVSRVGKYILLLTESLYAYIESTARPTTKDRVNEVLRNTDRYHGTSGFYITFSKVIAEIDRRCNEITRPVPDDIKEIESKVKAMGKIVSMLQETLPMSADFGKWKEYVETRLKELKDEDKKADGKIGED